MILMGHETEKIKSGSVKENAKKNENKPKIFCVNASGNIYQCTACATGKGASLALEELENAYSSELEPLEVGDMLKTIASKCHLQHKRNGEDAKNGDNEGEDLKFDVLILHADHPGNMRLLYENDDDIENEGS